MGKCKDCQGWDTSMAVSSPWGFCLFTGRYLSRGADGCHQFQERKPLVPLRDGGKRRIRGDGSGYLQIRYHTKKSGKSYEQYYYHYEIWENGVRQVKSCVYVPKTKLSTIQNLEGRKAPVTRILQELGKSW